MMLQDRPNPRIESLAIRLRDMLRDHHSFRGRKGASMVKQMAQRGAPDEFHDDGLDTVRAERVIYRHDAGVGEIEQCQLATQALEL